MTLTASEITGRILMAKRTKPKTKAGLISEQNKAMKRGDTLLAKIIKAKAGGKCQMCGDQGRNAHHIIPREQFATRHDPDNLIYLCFRCHKYSYPTLSCPDQVSAHKSSAGFIIKLMNLFPAKWSWVKKHYKDIACKADIDWVQSEANLKRIKDAFEEAGE